MVSVVNNPYIEFDFGGGATYQGKNRQRKQQPQIASIWENSSFSSDSFSFSGANNTIRNTQSIKPAPVKPVEREITNINNISNPFAETNNSFDSNSNNTFLSLTSQYKNNLTFLTTQLKAARV